MSASPSLVRRAALLSMLCLTAVAAALAPSASTAMQFRPYSVEILVDGVPIAEYATGRATYVQAIPGRDYSIRLTNRTPQRVAVALSVDGLNTVDAKTTTAREASKWILGPYQTITLDGWQTSSATARRFFFTSEQRSYGAWLGKTRNLGIISAAFFRERQPAPVSIWRDGGAREDSSLGEESGAPRAASPQSGMSSGEPKATDDLAATGIGQQIGHQVTRVDFDAEDSPAAVISLRYEYHDALVRLGVLPRPTPPCEDPLARRERSRGFEDTGFAPDPYRAPCR